MNKARTWLIVAVLSWVFGTACWIVSIHARTSWIESRNGSVISAGRFDWGSLSTVRYSRRRQPRFNAEIKALDLIVDETIYVDPVLRGDNVVYSYRDSKLYEVTIEKGKSRATISNQEALSQYVREANKLLAETRERFSRIMPQDVPHTTGANQ